MSGLWTPDGNRPAPQQSAAAERDDEDFPTGDPTESELAELESELLGAPVADVIANHCYGLFQLAALHLGHQPPNLEAARLAVDGFGLLVEGLGDRLGENEETLREGLAQLRLAFVQIAAAHDTGPPASEAGGAPN